MARLPLLNACLLFFGCIAEFPEPPLQFADIPVSDAAVDARPDLAVLDVTVPDANPCGVPEICDGLDQDCDLSIDESVPLLRCPLQLGVCKGSVQPCRAGAYQACLYEDTDQPYAMEEGPPDFCDGVDNDCDGALDEGCTCAPGDSRVCGSNDGQCVIGRQLCEEGVFGGCLGAVEPAIEQLNGVDDDCDGMSDEGPPPAEIILDLADIAVGGLGERPGLPGQVARGRGLPVAAPGVLVLRPAPFVAAVFVPAEGPSLIAEEVIYDFTGHVLGADTSGVHGKGPAGLVPHPAEVLGEVQYHDARAHSFIEMPANYGISFDLAKITRRFGRSAKRVTFRLGNLGPGRVTFFVLQDDMKLISQTLAGPQSPEPLSFDLLPLARTLTLVTTNAGEPGTRSAFFGDPELHFH